MRLLETPWHIFSTVWVLIVGLVFAIAIRKSFQCSTKRAIFIYLWHSFFSVVYAVIIINFGGDAALYYQRGVEGNVEFDWGTRGIEILTSVLVQGFGLSFLGTSLFFHIFGFIGLIAFDASLREVTKDSNRYTRLLAFFIVFLPSISFWSSGIGKDSISFMAMGLALWSSLLLERRFILLIIAVISLLFVRPHMAGIMVMSFSLSVIMKSDISILRRLIFGLMALAVSSILVPLGLDYAGVAGESTPSNIIDYIEERQGHNLGGGSSVDIASMNLPMQLLSYLIRPLPFEAHNFLALLASIDNTILLVMFLIALKPLFLKSAPVSVRGHSRMFLWSYVLISWSILSMTTANLGIAMRQKWMFVPILMFLLVSLMGKKVKLIDSTRRMKN